MERPEKSSKGSSRNGRSKPASKSRKSTDQVHINLTPEDASFILTHFHFRNSKVQVNAKLQNKKCPIVGRVHNLRLSLDALLPAQ